MKRVFLGEVTINNEATKVSVILASFLRPFDAAQGNLEIMRTRVKIMDKLEAAKDGEFVDLEDAQHSELCNIVRKPPVNIADKAIIEVADKVLNAKEPPKPEKTD